MLLPWLKYGDVLATSVMLRAIVGSASITSDFTFDAVPARDVSMTGAAALTVIVSLTVASWSLNSTLLSSPRPTLTSVER